MNQKCGFTLIELLVVVLIIGILSAVALPQYQVAVAKSRYMQTMTLANSALNAMEVYRMANGVWPDTLDVLDIELPGDLTENKKAVTFNGYTCTLYMGESDASDSILCSNTALILGYRVLFTADGRALHRCIAGESKALAQQVCTSLGGKNPSSNGAGLLHYSL